MKWKTKKKIYAVNEFQEENFEGIIKFSFGLSGFVFVGACMVWLLNLIDSGKALFDLGKVGISFIIPMLFMMILILVSSTLYLLAKRHSSKHFPIIEKIEDINNFIYTMSGEYTFIDDLLYDLEASCFDEEEKQYQNLKSVLNQYDDEIEHIRTIAKNRKQLEDNVKKVAVKRADFIIGLLKASIKKDKKQMKENKQLEIEAIEKEWNETYVSSGEEGFDEVEN